MPIFEQVKTHRKQILDIAQLHGAYNVRIFGSTARGNDTPASDLDVLIELALGKSLLDIIAIKQELEDLLGLKVDVVTETSLSPYLRSEILRTAVHL